MHGQSRDHVFLTLTTASPVVSKLAIVEVIHVDI